MESSLLDNLPRIGAAYDCETHLARPKYTPPLVCSSVATVNGAELLDKQQTLNSFPRLLEPGIVVIGANLPFDFIVAAVEFARIGVDILPQLFAKYARGEVFDILIAEKLDAIYHGHLGLDPRTGAPMRNPETGKQTSWYGLAIVVDHVLGIKTAKANDEWRERYALLEGIPIAQWPEEARKYPIDDVVNPLKVALAQAGFIPRYDGSVRRSGNIHALAEIVEADFALQLGASWGFAIDEPRARALLEATLERIQADAKQFLDAGILRKDGSKDKARLKRFIAVDYGGKEGTCPTCGGRTKVPSPKTGKDINCKSCDGTGVDLDSTPTIPRTPTGGVSTARAVIDDCDSQLLSDYAAWGEQDKIVTTYGPALLEGLPMIPNVPLANERVSYGGVVQLMPRKGGVRECVIARPGYVFSSVDFTGIEMVSWAQACIDLLGHSSLAEALNKKLDAHSLLGADMVGVSYEDFLPFKKTKYADERQAAKAGNFTFAGGGGVTAFVKAKRNEPGAVTIGADGRVYRGYRFCIMIGGAQACGVEKITEWRDRPIDVPLCKRCCEVSHELRETWKRRWTEANEYFDYVNRVVENDGFVTNLANGVVRGDVTFTQAANNYFSARAACGAKRAFVRVQRECLTVRSSPLWGSHAIGFIHDEGVCEHPEDRAHEAANRVSEIFVATMREVMPDVLVQAEPALSRRYYKGAEPVYDNGDPKTGRLIPWEPEA